MGTASLDGDAIKTQPWLIRDKARPPEAARQAHDVDIQPPRDELCDVAAKGGPYRVGMAAHHQDPLDAGHEARPGTRPYRSSPVSRQTIGGELWMILARTWRPSPGRGRTGALVR